MTKKTSLLNERVIRRWGKLANMPALTENFLDTIEEEEDDAPEGMEMDMDAEEPDEAPAGEGSAEEAAVEKLVQVVVDALAEEVPEMDIELEKDGEGEMEMEMGADDGDAAMMDDPAGMDEPKMEGIRKPASKDDDEDKKGVRSKAPAKKDDDEDEDKKANEELDLEVLDDEALTEAVLKRVVERLLKNK